MSRTEYVHYGCGASAPSEWTNFDASLTLRFERIPLLGKMVSKNECRFPSNVLYGDIVIGLPVAKDSCRGIYCSHVIEHLARQDAEAALKNTYAYLAPGGIFRAVVPNLEFYIRQYLLAAEGGEACANDVFMEKSGLGQQRRPRRAASRAWAGLGNYRHLWMWDRPALSELFRQSGFSSVRVCRPGDSEDPMFGLVEDTRRFADDAVYIEGRKA